MFEALKDKLEAAFSRLRNRGKLSEADVDAALREIRKSLLEADVDFKVVRDLIARIRERAVQLDVLESISAAQHIATVVYEELCALMGDPAPLTIASKPPTVILMAGLQGGGKTTTTVKLARRLKDSHSPLVVACDLRRPAAVEQLRVLAEESKTAFFGPAEGQDDVLEVVRGAQKYAADHLHDVILLDTAGRLHVDQELMDELSAIASALPPHEKLLVLDSMMGQEAVNVAKSFHELLTLTGLILTKLDGDARGGSALAVRAVTGVPVKFTVSARGRTPLRCSTPDAWQAGSWAWAISRASWRRFRPPESMRRRRSRRGSRESSSRWIRSCSSFSRSRRWGLGAR